MLRSYERSLRLSSGLLSDRPNYLSSACESMVRIPRYVRVKGNSEKIATA
ncbi:MAG: hypothetical protein HC769_11295 [Cyanobacteria bacterium CRU_2_1]|nr:hypothetical protein [Cyanobacteria bacterium RU_5_0]NJR59375.1 hypothetical protein [Cyanobacteria bacterium CRU_2_1]